jgi:hypothetical protein
MLPNGNVVVGWGGLPYVTEFRPGGGVHFDARLPAGGQNYRAFRLSWHANPHKPPRLAAHTTSGRRGLYVSWNGATEVAAWRLEAGPARNDLQPVLTRPKTSFETSLPVPRGLGFAAAVALDARARVLRRSNTIRL